MTSNLVNMTNPLIDTATTIDEENAALQLSLLNYLLGLIILIMINIGPYAYYKFYKNKKILASNNTGIIGNKQAI